jgi:hypothetical protein
MISGICGMTAFPRALIRSIRLLPAVGVGTIRIKASGKRTPRVIDLLRSSVSPCTLPLQSEAAGVGNNPDSFSFVVRSNGTSRNIKRPPGVAQGLQIGKHLVESHTDEPKRIFSKHPSRPQFFDKPAIFRPEPTVIFSTQSISGERCGLAGESSANNVDWEEPSELVSGKELDVAEAGCSRPMLAQDGSLESGDLAESNGLESTGSLKSEAESADATEEVKDTEHQSLALQPWSALFIGRPSSRTTGCLPSSR